MDVVIVSLHVLAAVFVVGPMVILPMSAMRAIRSGEAGQLRLLTASTRLCTWLSLLVLVTGILAVVVSPAQYHVTIATPWVLVSLLLTVVAIVLMIALVLPSMGSASVALESGAAAGRYPAIAAGSGTASILLVVVVVLMVWKP